MICLQNWSALQSPFETHAAEVHEINKEMVKSGNKAVMENKQLFHFISDHLQKI
jgi:hypothetical protein